MDAVEDSRPKGVVLVLQQLRKVFSLFFIEAVLVSHFLHRLMRHGYIQCRSRFGGFGLHDVAVAVIGFGDDRFRMAFRAGGYSFISQNISLRSCFLVSSIVATSCGLSGSVLTLTE